MMDREIGAYVTCHRKRDLFELTSETELLL